MTGYAAYNDRELTVQQLIDKLQKIENKSLKVRRAIIASGQQYEPIKWVTIHKLDVIDSGFPNTETIEVVLV